MVARGALMEARRDASAPCSSSGGGSVNGAAVTPNSNQQRCRLRRQQRLALAAAAAAPMMLLLLLALLAAAADARAVGCARGDLPCHCRAAGGYWETPPSPLLPTCKVKIRHQGRERSANVYLPPNYQPSSRAPMWIHLHGVFWKDMGGIGGQVGGFNVQAADATALWDKLVNGKAHREGAIIVYPQSLGDPGSRQFFQNGFWSCSVGVCMDKGIDDVGFLDQVVSQLPSRFSADPRRLFVSGKSAGGVLAHAALCRGGAVAQRARAVVDVLGGVPDAMAAACAPARRMPSIMLIHGEKDEHLPWARPVVLDYVPFMSKVGVAEFWRNKLGLFSKTSRAYDGGRYNCEYWTKGGGGGEPKVALCGIRDAGHTTDIPYVGAPFDLAWSFLSRFR